MSNFRNDSMLAEFQQEYENREFPLLPESLSGYRFVSCLADSGLKKAWLMESPDGQPVLCKYASGPYIEMLRTENEFFSARKYPFIPYIIDYMETDQGAYLLREYIKGQTLEELVLQHDPLSLAEALPIIRQLCGHLSRLHSAQPPIIFRDLKPSNVVLDSMGNCYLIDVGTVRTYHEGSSSDTVMMGTMDVAAPEQFGARQTSNRTDIYGLGILFYFLLTGELKVQEELLQKLPRRAAQVIRKCTAFDPDHRYPRIEDVPRALGPGHRFRRLLAGTIVCAVVVLAGCFLLPYLMSSRPVTFSSPLLEQAVREELGKTEEEAVYPEDLTQITKLFICGNLVFHQEDDHGQFSSIHFVQDIAPQPGDIEDISLLAKMPNLHYVVLDHQQIRDISPLKDLELITLSLSGNPVTDLSPLREQTSLTTLYLAETEIFSLKSLQDCSALTTLDISYTSVAALTPVASFPIHSLFLEYTAVTDYSLLTGMPIQELCCSYVPQGEFPRLASLPSLERLTLYRSDITSLKEVTCFGNLSMLDLTENQIRDLDGLEYFTGLDALFLNENPISDLSPLARMNNLTYLGLSINSHLDFSFLRQMPQVEYVAVKVFNRKALYEAVPDPWFRIEWYQ